MPRFEADRAECLILTYKEGLLSAVAHDLKIRAERFWVEVGDGGEGAVSAEFDATSLRVACAMVDGRESPSTLSARDKGKIEDNIKKEVLDARRHPQVRFEGKIEGKELSGTLDLHGRKRPLRAAVREDGDKSTVEVRLHQPDFGIKPYSAMLGALKIKPEITVKVSLPKASEG